MIRFRTSGIECLVTDDFDVECDDADIANLVEIALSFEVRPSEGFFWQAMAYQRIPEVLGVDVIEVLEITPMPDVDENVLY